MARGYGKAWRQGLCTALTFCMVTAYPLSGRCVNVYDAVCVEGNTTLHTEYLATVYNAESALEAVSRQAASMSEEQKKNPVNVEEVLLFTEEAVASAVHKADGAEILHISKETLSALTDTARDVRDKAVQTLQEGGLEAHRKVAATATLETTASGFTLIVHSDILDTGIDKVRVSKVNAPEFSITFRPADFKAELRPDEQNPEPRTLAIAVALAGQTCEPGTTVSVPNVKIDVPNGQLSAPITLSLNPGSNEPSALTVEGAAGEYAATRYNPASRTLDARLDASDIYTFGRRNVYFTDLLEKDRKIRTAVETLARVNVVYGYGDHTFRPENAVTRAEFVAFVMRALGRVNNSLKSPFEDVTEGHGCYHEIASAYYYGIIKGYDETHFCGEQLISKTQIYAILGRIMEREMGYWPPENPSEYLAYEFSDAIDEWARSDIAIATREGLVIRQSTGRFDGQMMMDRGDVALIIYGLYQRLA